MIDLVLLDVRLPKLGGLEVLQRIRQLEAELPVVMITAYADVQTAVAAMKSGASDYLLKGFDLEELLLVVQHSLETSAMSRELRQLRREHSDNYHFTYLVGHSERMREVFEMVARVARSDTASVLITGESGTGKEVVAHAIHVVSSKSSINHWGAQFIASHRRRKNCSRDIAGRAMSANSKMSLNAP